MSFPVLTAHQIYPYFFQLGGRLSPISIRDQMVRGQMLVEQAIHAGLIGGPDRRPLLVVGAGAAGATVAMTAAALNVPTLLVDEGPAPFRLQLRCRTRLLDPAHYDWPVAHWDVHTYPWTSVSRPVPLPWRRDFSDRVAVSWMSALGRAVRRFPWLNVTFLTTVRPMRLVQSCWTFQLTKPGYLPLSVSAGMVVWTVGFGNETSLVSPSRMCNHAVNPVTGQRIAFFGFPFWSTDPYAHPTYQLPPGTLPQIVISGGGDGGLQDFLRIVADPRYQAAGAIFRALQLPTSLPGDLLSAETRAQRAFHWGDRAVTRWNGYDHVVLQNIHDEHRQLARDYAQKPPVQRRLRMILRRNPPEELHLVHDCTHFPNVYPLNRFLVLLISEYLNRPQLLISRRRTLEVNSANVAGHVCNGSHIRCHGEDHDVHLVNAPHCLFPFDPQAIVVQILRANAVIIRHGIDVRTLTQPHLPDIALTRQLPPFHVH
jgi:hypothetical protein